MTEIKKDKKNYNYYSRFASVLRELLETNNVKQEELAQYVGVTRQAISQYKEGITKPDIYVFQKIVEYFRKNHNVNYSFEYWLGGSSPSSSNNIENISFSTKTINALEEYQNNKLLWFTLEEIIQDENFIKKLCEYLVIHSLNEKILYDDFLRNYFTIKLKTDFPVSISNKYLYADLVEYLARLKMHIQGSIQADIEKDRNTTLILEYIKKLSNENFPHSLYCTTNFNNTNEDEELEKITDIEEFTNSNEYKKFDDKFEQYFNQ